VATFGFSVKALRDWIVRRPRLADRPTSIVLLAAGAVRQGVG
jgi:hypothetical protein